jgi:hypothetical protein
MALIETCGQAHLLNLMGEVKVTQRTAHFFWGTMAMHLSFLALMAFGDK